MVIYSRLILKEHVAKIQQKQWLSRREQLRDRCATERLPSLFRISHLWVTFDYLTNYVDLSYFAYCFSLELEH